MTGATSQPFLDGGPGEAISISAHDLQLLNLGTGQTSPYALPASWAEGGIDDAAAMPDGNQILGITAGPSSTRSLAVSDDATTTFASVPLTIDTSTYQVDPEIVLSGDGNAAEVVVQDANGNKYGVFVHRN